MFRRTRGEASADAYAVVSAALDRIEELDRLHGSDPEANRLLRKQIVAELPPVRAHLEAVPQDDERVRADVHARGLAGTFPWRRLNAGTARDLAVLYCFTPYLDTSALVAARRLHARAVVTDVISQEIGDVARSDPSSDLIAREFLDDLTEFPGVADFGEWTSARTFAEGVVATVAEHESVKGPYRTLYTRAMAAQAHFAGAVLKARRPELVWTAEFSDPLRINPIGETRTKEVEDDWLFREVSAAVQAAGFTVPDESRMFTWAELVAFALADEVVFTNDHQKELMLQGCEYPELSRRAAQVAVVRPQPTLPESFYHLRSTIYPLSDDVINIGYFGAFYASRGLDEVVAALESLSETERGRVRLHVFTSNPDRRQQELNSRDLGEVIVVRPYVPYLKFLNLTTRFDVLLVNDFSTRGLHALNPYLPAKVSDYLGSGRPIWGVYEKDSVLSSLDTAYASELGDAEGAAAVLRRLISELGSEDGDQGRVRG
jgi:hypothetical protein